MPLTAPAKVTSSPTDSGYLYAQYGGTFKALPTGYRYGKYVQNVQSVTVAVRTVELH